jgi:hypothetical protein
MVDRNYTRRNSPDSKIHRVYQTLGEKISKELGLERTGANRSGRFTTAAYNVNFLKDLDRTPGNIFFDVNGWNTGHSEQEAADGTLVVNDYGCLHGIAHVNQNGQGTMRSNIVTAVIPDFKGNALQYKASREGFMEMCKKHGRLMGPVEINPTSLSLFESKETNEVGLPAFRLLVIEAAGVYGVNSKGQGIYWSIQQYPLSDFVSTDEEKPAEQSAGRSRRSRTAPATTPADAGASADMEKEPVTAG